MSNQTAVAVAQRAPSESKPKEMRATLAETLIALATEDERIVLLDADLMTAHGTCSFRKQFPGRTFNMGVAEANMVSTAAGLSSTGKIPFAMTFACFAARRAFDQFFISANYARRNVKLVGSDPGISALYNGGTHMTFEDLGIMKTVPGLVVFEPSDNVSLRKLMKKSAGHEGCTYMRLHRKSVVDIYADTEEFELGKGKVLVDGDDLTIIALGALMVPEALKAAEMLAQQDGLSVAVIDILTVKPLDAELVLAYAAKTGAVMTCENHQIINGLGSAVADVLAENLPTPMKRIGIADEFGEVGDLAYLMQRFGLTAGHIAAQARELLKRTCKSGKL
ncbi:MAG: transketolase family protein [Kiritimatiellales bacterium]|nr:transketolase family protein [Kiritimatiellales bacterium]MCF7863834.1 transketolase family protein [Kiritimatiellales bacterium]